MRAAGWLNELPLWVCDDVGISPLDIRARLFRFLEEKQKHDFDLIVLDGLALLEAEQSPNRSSIYQQFASTLRGLKLLAREFSVPLLVTYALSRLTDTNKRAKAQLADIQPSSFVEQFADVVCLRDTAWPDPAWREKYSYSADMLDEPLSNLVEITIILNRRGPLGEISVYYNDGCGLFRDLVATPADPEHPKSTS